MTSKLIVPVAAVADTVVNSDAFFKATARLDVEPANVTLTPSDVAPEIWPTVAALSYRSRVDVPLKIDVLLIVTADGPAAPVDPVGPVGPAGPVGPD